MPLFCLRQPSCPPRILYPAYQISLLSNSKAFIDIGDNTIINNNEQIFRSLLNLISIRIRKFAGFHELPPLHGR